MLIIQWKKLNENAYIPTRATSVASGWDFLSPITFTVKAGERAICPTEMAVQLALDEDAGIMVPDMRLAGCSGNAAKRGVAILGGIIDNDYQGHVKAILLNTSKEDITISKGDKLCQGIIGLVFKDSYIRTEEVTDFEVITERGIKGFGEMTGVIGDTK